MNSTSTPYQIVESGDLYFIHQDGQQLLSPKGNPLFLDNEELLGHLIKELEESDNTDVQKLSLYSMCCTWVDYTHKLQAMPRKVFRTHLIMDPVITAGDGPEKFHQVAKWTPLFEYLDHNGLQHPDLRPMKDLKGLEAQIKERGGDYSSQFENLVTHFFEIYQGLGTRAKVAVMNAIQLYKAPVYALLLSLKKADVEGFAHGLLAAMMILPEVRSDISEVKYQIYLEHIQKDAQLLQRFAIEL